MEVVRRSSYAAVSPAGPAPMITACFVLWDPSFVSGLNNSQNCFYYIRLWKKKEEGPFSYDSSAKQWYNRCKCGKIEKNIHNSVT